MKLGGEIITEKAPTGGWVAWFPIGSKLRGWGLTEEKAIEDLCRKRVDQYLDHPE